MENKCWFCGVNDAADDMEYIVELKNNSDRKDRKSVEIARCESCAAKHRKGDFISTLMYILQIVLVTVLYFVVKLELIYIALIYIALMRPLTSLAKKIRQMTADPDKSVCDVAEHEEVKAMIEEGYIETRRF